MRHKENSSWHQGRLQRILVGFVLIVLISLACNLPTSLPITLPEQIDPGLQTGVAGTVAVLEIDQPPAGTDVGLTGTQTPGVSTTLTPFHSPTSSGSAKVFLSENTNCRTGQGTSFERLTILLKGEEAEAVGIDTSGNYWYIRRPDKLTEFCWLWGGYVTPTGSYESLPVFTQVPTATPGFEFGFIYQAKIGLCGGFHVLQYRINNTGSVTLESWQTSATDHTGGSNPQLNQQNKFVDNTGCVPGGEMANLPPGASNYVNALFNNDPTGHDLTVTVKICSADGLGGSCRSMTISHTP